MTRRLWALLTVVATGISMGAGDAGADLLPPGQEPIPRLVALRGIERFDEHVLILSNCYPQMSEEDPVGMPYCVVVDSEPFVASGKGWLARRADLTLKKRTPSRTADAGPAAALRMKPVVIEKPHVNYVEPEQFFGKSELLTPTDLDLGIRDHVAVETNKHLASVTEVYRVEQLDGDGVKLTPVKVIWACEDGQRIDGPAPGAPGKLPEAPRCAPAPVASVSVPAPLRPPRPSPRAGGTPRPYWVALVVLVGVGIGALVWSRRRRAAS